MPCLPKLGLYELSSMSSAVREGASPMACARPEHEEGARRPCMASLCSASMHGQLVLGLGWEKGSSESMRVLYELGLGECGYCSRLLFNLLLRSAVVYACEDELVVRGGSSAFGLSSLW
ncbi:hypothetical protein Dimus_003519 [Dionaea muscipula]